VFTRNLLFMNISPYFQLSIESSIGVTSGTAFCGLVGGRQRREYTVLGDVVNLSARLMQKANGGTAF
jgi:class 3 adenylate cyclase